MLRLWPETLYAGLFPGACWLAGARGQTALAGSTSQAGPGGLLAELEAMLAQLPDSPRRARRLHLVVSDGLAAIATLPWQEKLSGQAELDAYALACFERHGLEIDATWATQTGFRQFRGGGLAYALPHAWLRELIAVCAKFGVRLETVLPVSAAAYWRLAPARAAAQSVLVLAEAHRVTGLVYEAGRLMQVDVQPVIGDAETAGTRLLLRLSASYRAIGGARYWSAGNAALAPAPQFITACLPLAETSHLARQVWN